MFFAENEEPIKAFAANGTYESFCNRVHVWRADRGADGLDAVRIKIKKFAAVIMNHADKIFGFFDNLLGKQDDLLPHKVLNGIAGNGKLNNLSGFMFDDKIDVITHASNRIDSKEIHRIDAADLHFQEFGPTKGASNFTALAKPCENPAYRRFGKIDPYFAQLALDVTGAENIRICIFYLKNEFLNFSGNRRPAGPAFRREKGPAASDNLSLPVQQSFRFYDMDFFFDGREPIKEREKNSFAVLCSYWLTVKRSAQNFIFLLQQHIFSDNGLSGFAKKPQDAQDKYEKLKHCGVFDLLSECKG